MAEFKLSYTAKEIDEKLGKIDSLANLVVTIDNSPSTGLTSSHTYEEIKTAINNGRTVMCYYDNHYYHPMQFIDNGDSGCIRFTKIDEYSCDKIVISSNGRVNFESDTYADGSLETILEDMDASIKELQEQVQNGTGGSAIIDVGELPTENINQNAFYRLVSAKFVVRGGDNGLIPDTWECCCVSELPETGKNISDTESSYMFAYYNSADNEVYGYFDEEYAALLGVSAGWMSWNDIAQAFGLAYGGVITDVTGYYHDDILRVLLTYGKIYMYQDGWCELPLAYEKANKMSISWDGVIGDRFNLDMSPLGFTGTTVVKISDKSFSVDELIGCNVYRPASNGDSYEYTITESDIDTSAFPGAITVRNGEIISVYSADEVNTALGLPSGYLTNGLYFPIYENASGVIWWTSNLTKELPNTIKKIDEKFLPDMTTSSGIIDVTELPTENINKNAFYRLSTSTLNAKFVSNFYPVDGWKCYCVDGLPETGEPVSTDMVNITAYYNTQDNEVYGYADSNISAVGGIPVGWYPLGTLAQAFNVDWGGVVTDDSEVDDSAKVLLYHTRDSQDLYTYQDKWIKHIFASEEPYKYDITWDGDTTDRPHFVYNDFEYYKVGNDILTRSECMDGTVTIMQGTTEDSAVVTGDLSGLLYFEFDYGINFIGTFGGGHFVIFVYDSDAFATQQGISSDTCPNGTYFIKLDNDYISRLTTKEHTKITKIDAKYLDVDVDLTAYAKTSDLSAYAKTSALTAYAKTSDLSTYAKTSALTAYAKTTELDAYAKTTDVETMIENAIGAAIGGSY